MTKVFFTGQAGFKGVWFRRYLEGNGYQVFGFSDEPSNQNKKRFYLSSVSNDEVARDTIGDIRDFKCLEKSFKAVEPEIVVHFAAQSLVSVAAAQTSVTLSTNILGTNNLLGLCFASESVKKILYVTSDKVYENDESGRPFVEDDPLGGFSDFYSASKACQEILGKSYVYSYPAKEIRLISARAGNVIGGGDFNYGRLFPDCFNAKLTNSVLNVRNPNGIRPWQHVSDCCQAYFKLLESKTENDSKYSGINVGPPPCKDRYRVADILNQIKSRWNVDTKIIPNTLAEKSQLSLNTNKFAKQFGNIFMGIEESIDRTMAEYESIWQALEADKKSIELIEHWLS